MCTEYLVSFQSVKSRCSAFAKSRRHHVSGIWAYRSTGCRGVVLTGAWKAESDKKLSVVYNHLVVVGDHHDVVIKHERVQVQHRTTAAVTGVIVVVSNHHVAVTADELQRWRWWLGRRVMQLGGRRQVHVGLRYDCWRSGRLAGWLTG